MPGLFFQPSPRRRFLTQSGQLAGALVYSRFIRAFADAFADRRFRLALLSDTHIAADPRNENRKFVPWDNLNNAVPQVLKAKPAAVLLNGDAARTSGELADYQELKKLLTPLAETKPVYIGLGNHDNRENFFKVFDSASTSPSRQNVPGKHILVVDTPPIRILVLDSLLYVNQVAGLLGKAQREWLKGFLADSGAKPLALFVHHTLGQEDGELLDADRLFQIVRPHKQVKAIFYGHSHEYSLTSDSGIHLINLPALGYNFKDSEPVGWVESEFTPEGVELNLHAMAGNVSRHGLTTSLAWRT